MPWAPGNNVIAAVTIDTVGTTYTEWLPALIGLCHVSTATKQDCMSSCIVQSCAEQCERKSNQDQEYLKCCWCEGPLSLLLLDLEVLQHHSCEQIQQDHGDDDCEAAEEDC